MRLCPDVICEPDTEMLADRCVEPEPMKRFPRGQALITVPSYRRIDTLKVVSSVWLDGCFWRRVVKPQQCRPPRKEG